MDVVYWPLTYNKIYMYITYEDTEKSMCYSRPELASARDLHRALKPPVHMH